MDQYGNRSMGYKKYTNAEFFRSSAEEIFTKKFLEGYMHDLHINFVSSEGRAESYNMLHRKGPNEKFFADFISANPQVGHHFQTRMETCEDLINDVDKEAKEEIDRENNCDCDNDCNCVTEVDEDRKEDGEGEAQATEVAREKSTMHLLGRKNLSSGFYNHELICELQERGQLGDACFGPKVDPRDENLTVSYKASMEQFMQQVEVARREEIYKHTTEDCSEGCRGRGCGQVKR